MSESMRATVTSMLRGIERYNPENATTLERYVSLQCEENTYDLDANLALLKLYQCNPQKYQKKICYQILMKAITNLPHTDFVLCKCLLGQEQMEDPQIKRIMYLHDILEMCQIDRFWADLNQYTDLTIGIKDFEESIRKYFCHVIGITYQHIEKHNLMTLLGCSDDSMVENLRNKYGWKEVEPGVILIGNQEEIVKTKNITEKIDFDAVAGIMAACR